LLGEQVSFDFMLKLNPAERVNQNHLIGSQEIKSLYTFGCGFKGAVDVREWIISCIFFTPFFSLNSRS